MHVTLMRVAPTPLVTSSANVTMATKETAEIAVLTSTSARTVQYVTSVLLVQMWQAASSVHARKDSWVMAPIVAALGVLTSTSVLITAVMPTPNVPTRTVHSVAAAKLDTQTSAGVFQESVSTLMSAPIRSQQAKRSAWDGVSKDASTCLAASNVHASNQHMPGIAQLDRASTQTSVPTEATVVTQMLLVAIRKSGFSACATRGSLAMAANAWILMSARPEDPETACVTTRRFA